MYHNTFPLNILSLIILKSSDHMVEVPETLSCSWCHKIYLGHT